jgi:hypothetical protein
MLRCRAVDDWVTAVRGIARRAGSITYRTISETEAFEGLPAYPAFYSAFRRISVLFPSLARLGAGRLIPPDRALPKAARNIQRLHHASPRLYRSLRDEFAQLRTSLHNDAAIRDVVHAVRFATALKKS